MSLKIILIMVGSFLAVAGLTIAGLLIFRPGQIDQSMNAPIGIRPTDNFVFDKIDDVVGLPAFTQLPNQDDNWTRQITSDDSNFTFVQYSNPNGCSMTITSQPTPYPNKALADYVLSKDLAYLTAAGVQGTLSDDYIIKVATTNGDAYFYAGTYSPNIRYTHPDGLIPSTSGGSVPVTGSYTTFLAVRSVATTIVAGSGSGTEGVLGAQDMIPSVAISYECKTDAFDVKDAAALIKQIIVNFVATDKIPSNTLSSGK